MKRTVLAASLFTCNVFAQVSVVPPEVVNVTTVGRWQSGPTSGSYRVTTTTDGWEHLWSHVTVEWLPDPSSREEGHVNGKIVELVPPAFAPGTAVLEASAQQRKVGELIVTVLATSNMDLHAKPQRFIFAATGPGTVKLISAKRQ